MNFKTVLAFAGGAIIATGLGLVFWHQAGIMFPSVKAWTNV